MTTVISMCSSLHVDVWKCTSQLLPKFVVADRYIVFVPRVEVEMFKEVTAPGIEIHEQEVLGAQFHSDLYDKVEKSGNKERFGWYLQQFYKIQALINIQDDNLVIWDADCVPVKPIETKNSSGKVVYVSSSGEFHEPYFTNIRDLLDMNRTQNYSFVIPGFPIRKKWINEFIEYLENKHCMPWYEAIMTTTKFNLRSGFSETETLGTFIHNLHASEIANRDGTWERFGQSRFGYARNLTPKDLIDIGLKHNLEIITFENWDKSRRRRFIGRLLRTFRK